MTQEACVTGEVSVGEINQKPCIKKKRDIFRFQGEKDLSINLEHVTNMFVEDKRITFQFYNSASFIDLEDEAAAKKAYEQIISIWSCDAIV
jgi:hypothetical protein